MCIEKTRAAPQNFSIRSSQLIQKQLMNLSQAHNLPTYELQTHDRDENLLL